MFLWILLALLTAGVVLVLAKGDATEEDAPKDDVAADINVYIDQLDQIETERFQGVLSESEATSARAEVARRLLTQDREESSTNSPPKDEKALRQSISTISILLSIPLLTLGLYLVIGSPHLPGLPHASRQMPTASEANIETLIEKVEARLREAPEDGTGWDVIAPIYMRLGKYDKAIDAYQKASRILGETPNRLVGLIQSNILFNNGQVTPEARTLSERLLQLDPDRIEARLWLALAKEQNRQWDDARKDYEELLRNPTLSQDLRAVLQERLEVILKRGNADDNVSPRSAPPLADRDSSPTFTNEERQTIEEMVNRLATRLASEGQDVEGWTKLLRSYIVLGRKDKAQEALMDARRALAQDASSLAKLDAEAANLGLPLQPRIDKENEVQ